MTQGKTEVTGPISLCLSDTIKVISVLVTIFVVVIPVVGYCYHAGYLAVFNLGSDLFAMTIVELWEESLIVFLLASVKVLKSIPVAATYFIAILFVFFMLMMGVYYLLKKNNIKTYLLKSNAKQAETSLLAFLAFLVEEMVKDWGQMYKIVMYVLVALLMVMAPVIKAFQLGYENATQERLAYKEKGCMENNVSRCYVFKHKTDLNQPEYAGILIKASRQYIALYDGNEAYVVPRFKDYVLIKYYSLQNKQDKRLNDHPEPVNH